ncbi:MAG: class I SAM-dependent methyltransferase [Cyclobacteriaceae bacterium]
MHKDLFSAHAKDYATFRPAYPQGLYDFIFQYVERFDKAWDCGTGNGQVARSLAAKFQEVHGSDISAAQLRNAWPAKNIQYHQFPAEQSTFADNTFDLVAVGQAIHWFDIDKFYVEVKRVAKPGAAVAMFGYNLVRFNSAFNELLDQFYREVIYSYWETERKLVDSQYQTLSFPFKEIDAPDFKMPLSWSLQDLHGYITTWSAVQKFIRQNGVSPVDDFIKKVEPLWKHHRESVYFPVFLRLGKVTK